MKMNYILTKKNILAVFGEVKQTIDTPTTITILMNTENAATAVEVRCVDQQENSLMKMLYTL